MENKIDIKDSTPKRVGDNIKRIAEIDIFKNTRKREYVEYRALVCFLLRDKLGMRWTYIANYFKSEGKDMHHATIMHLFKMYPIYKLHNKKLGSIEAMFNFKSSLSYDEIDKIHYLQSKCNNLESKQRDYKDKMETPLAKLLGEIPINKFKEVEDRIKLFQASWDW